MDQSREVREILARHLFLQAHPDDEYAVGHWDHGGTQHVAREPWLKRADEILDIVIPVKPRPVTDRYRGALWLHWTCGRTMWTSTATAPEDCDYCMMRTDRWSQLYVVETRREVSERQNRPTDKP